MIGENNPDTLTAMNTLAALYRRQGRHAEAERLCLKTLRARRQVLGEHHPFTLGTLYELARIHAASGETNSALVLLRDAIEGGFTRWGHPDKILEDWSGFDGNPEYEAIVAGIRAQRGAR
jgi:hypothetical protein